MPEGPELYLSCQFINDTCRNRYFGGSVSKSEVSKNPEVHWNVPAYKIAACSRGKEIKVTLTEAQSPVASASKGDVDLAIKSAYPELKTLDIVIRFGMSGLFKFTNIDDLPKHSHLRFYTAEEPFMVLSFVDARRFGRWEVNGDWTKDRGPDPLLEYSYFRKHVLSNLKDPAFKRPICEVLLNQKYFNGIGNYLRAEILYRAKIPPFAQALRILESLEDSEVNLKLEDSEVNVKLEESDILKLCHIVPSEVIQLGGGKWYGGSSDNDWKAFEEWLQCYMKPSMNSLLDHNKRTIWYEGEPGEMSPKGGKPRGKTKASGSADTLSLDTPAGAQGKKARNASKPKGIKIEKVVNMKTEVTNNSENREKILTPAQKLRGRVNSKLLSLLKGSPNKKQVNKRNNIPRMTKTPVKRNSTSTKTSNKVNGNERSSITSRRTSTRLAKTKQ